MDHKRKIITQLESLVMMLDSEHHRYMRLRGSRYNDATALFMAHVKDKTNSVINLLGIDEWIKIEDCPEEWKDGRGLWGLCALNECQLEFWWDDSPLECGWVSTHAIRDFDISHCRPLASTPHKKDEIPNE